jgi:hypothetical protein
MTGKQLDLFAGVLLTADQQKQVDNYIAGQNNGATFRENETQRIEKMLIEAGFIKGVHFKNNFESATTTRTVTLGYSYNQTQFEVEVTAKTYTGGISLLGKRFDSLTKELKDTTFSFDVERDKLQSWSIQDQARYVKPKTLLNKLLEHNENAVYQFEQYQKQINLEKSVIEKYTKLYPNAAIIAKDDYSKYSGSYRVIEVRFASGSYIQFKLDTYNLKEYLYKKHDATFEKLTTEDLLDKFSKQ